MYKSQVVIYLMGIEVTIIFTLKCFSDNKKNICIKVSLHWSLETKDSN